MRCHTRSSWRELFSGTI